MIDYLTLICSLTSKDNLDLLQNNRHAQMQIRWVDISQIVSLLHLVKLIMKVFFYSHDCLYNFVTYLKCWYFQLLVWFFNYIHIIIFIFNFKSAARFQCAEKILRKNWLSLTKFKNGRSLSSRNPNYILLIMLFRWTSGCFHKINIDFE